MMLQLSECQFSIFRMLADSKQITQIIPKSRILWSRHSPDHAQTFRKSVTRVLVRKNLKDHELNRMAGQVF